MIKTFQTPDGNTLAYEQVSAKQPNPHAPTFVFCGGFRSDMQGSKAICVCGFAKTHEAKALRFDYFAHGESSGNFADGSIGRWLEDTLSVIDALTDGPIVLVGSSMGGWIATLAAQSRPERLRGLVLLAAAPDFTRRLMWAEMDEAARQHLMSAGKLELPNDYSDEPYEIHRHLIEEADAHMVLDGPIAIEAPVRLIHGLEDTDVPWQLAQELMLKIKSSDVEMHLIKNGDHRLSSEADLNRLRQTLKLFL